MLLGVDVGGTFTDAVLLTPERAFTGKAPSTPADQSEGVLAAVQAVLESAGAQAADVTRFVHGMTVGTNALLERKVATTALLATEGFTDIEELGRQTRAELYRLCAGNPPPLVPEALRVGVPERCGPEGVITPLDEEELGRRLAVADAAESFAVCLLWGFRHSEHESRVAALVGERLPDAHISTSHETAALFREYERCATTVVDAALSPLLRRYLEQLTTQSQAAGLPAPEVMLSSGGVAGADAAARHGSWTVLSGPAGGAVGAGQAALRAGAATAVCLDMGGTSCDVSVASDGIVVTGSGREVGGRALALPMVDVHTVGAGGGSIAWRDEGGALRVGPGSAGADPGPACYGRGGTEPTVTDANLMLGRLDPGNGLAGGVELDLEAATRVVSRLAGTLGLDAMDAAAGIVRVAAAQMAQAVRVMTVERGSDPRDMALVAFGGAGPLHACAIADELGMTRIIVPEASGVLSALGLVISERRRDLVESVLLRGPELTADAVGAAVAALAARGRSELGAPDAAVRCAFDLRYPGQAHELTVTGGQDADPADLRSAFEKAHLERYGYDDADAGVELVTIRVTVAEPGAELPAEASSGGPADLSGPEVCPLGDSTLYVAEGWSGGHDGDRAIVLERD
ncbi:MAG: N-methylhydantoinase [Thermoleophilaceae bacterium]|nr:N-methylhydantoinase [Thermoleophilaceae bacterium]